MDQLLRQVDGRSQQELEKMLLENAREDASLFKDTVFVPEMGVHPAEGQQEKV